MYVGSNRVNHKEEKIALMYFLFLCLKVGFAFCTGSSSFRKMMSITMEFIDMENMYSPERKYGHPYYINTIEIGSL